MFWQAKRVIGISKIFRYAKPSSDFNAAKDNDNQILQFSKNIFLGLTESLLTIFSNPLDKYNLETVLNHYSSYVTIDNSCLNNTSENEVFKPRSQRLSAETGFLDLG